MGNGVGDPLSDADRQELAEQACQRLLAAVSSIERSPAAVLREIRDSLEVEIMIDRGGRQRRQLLRQVADYCDQRIRDKEGGHGAGGVSGAFRALVSGRRKPSSPSGTA